VRFVGGHGSPKSVRIWREKEIRMSSLGERPTREKTWGPEGPSVGKSIRSEGRRGTRRAGGVDALGMGVLVLCAICLFAMHERRHCTPLMGATSILGSECCVQGTSPH